MYYSAFQSNAFQLNAYQIARSSDVQQNTGGWYDRDYEDPEVKRKNLLDEQRRQAEEEIIRLSLEAQKSQLEKIEAQKAESKKNKKEELAQIEAKIAEMDHLIALQVKQLLMIENQKALIALSLAYPWMKIIDDRPKNVIINLSGHRMSGP